ncbi:DUF979 domain-containing protein [Solihabitans fulvus]|uniref:DUF979 domain-containing protein n=1 Tax=Solihabitans fulvus TaxID=1892852 RepID=A0A5B2XEU2_9PSEU|nr:DUF979 domain-containing protein [Solihabitans fulvus]KAA2262328.1 DUF979 domain-containing protein [Solihabitans fulvus]
MITADWLYWLCGAIFLGAAVIVGRDRENPKRIGSVAFWALLGLSFWYGTFVVRKAAPPWLLGLAVIAMACLAGFGALGKGGGLRSTTEKQRVALAERFGGRVFVPALIIPVVAILFATLVVKIKVNGQPLLLKGSETLIGLGVGSVLALVVGLLILRPTPASIGSGPLTPAVPLREGTRLLQAIGWAAVLPQMLATLGLLFDQAGVGKVVGKLTKDVLPQGSLIWAVVVYCLGMAVFTIVMGNAFAAFPVMTAAVGWPVLIQQFHGNPPVVFAVGMLAGFCGTLCTPMAANFNIVPAVLLEMKNQYGPIKAQLPTAIPLLACNVAIMYFFAF